MAILAAFNSPAVEIIGMTTIFGNVRTTQATANALVLRELAEREDVSGGWLRPQCWSKHCQYTPGHASCAKWGHAATRTCIQPWQ